MTNVYDWADNEINSSPRYDVGFTQLLPAAPYRVSPDVRRLYDTRFALIRSFQQTALEIFKAALHGDLPPIMLHWLLNETAESLGLSYHRTLEDRHFTVPLFFRTDETRHGRLLEIQCPGSLWGELQIAYEYTKSLGYDVGDVAPAQRFGMQATDYLQTTPIVHHHMDKASAPAGTRYFIQRTRPLVRYWGIDHGVKMSDCNFIRHHTFITLWAEDNLHALLARTGNGITFDYPPLVLFDEKAPLALPFWSMTRAAFSDEVRSLFPFITPLLPSGIELPDGSTISIEAFSRWSRSQRSYYLKLAGFNVELNWGSKAVYRLSNLSSEACLDFLRQCLSGYERGQIWLLQQEEAQDDEITYLTRDGSVHTQNMRAKFSGFYGPAGCLGVIAQHRHHYKVHGQDDTVLSYVLPDDAVA